MSEIDLMPMKAAVADQGAVDVLGVEIQWRGFK